MSCHTTAVLSIVAWGTVVTVGVVPVMGQTGPPRTPWGAPDLMGVWDFRSITPMERPEELADKAFLTEEEVAAREEAVVALNQELLEAPPQRTTAGESVDQRPGGAVGAYNNFWLDRGTEYADTRRTSLVVDPPDGRIPAHTAAGQRRADQLREERQRADWTTNFSSGVRCILGFNAGPPMNPSAYNNNMQIHQTPETVAIVTEMVQTVRIVPLDGRPPLPDHVLQWSGDSRGHWEGDTLVVVTRNFDPKRKWRNTTSSMTLTERITRVDAETLMYEFTVDDPETWTAPWTAEVPMKRNPDPMFEFACHEGNYSMPGMLGGARREEAQVVAGR